MSVYLNIICEIVVCSVVIFHCVERSLRFELVALVWLARAEESNEPVREK